MKHFLYDASDFLRNICTRPKGKDKSDKKDSQQDKIELLENMLNRSDMLLKDLQDEFDARIKESHQDDLVEFFSRLNSEKYGCILDEVLNARNGVRQLRKKNIQLPPEIGGLFILIEKFAQFIRDSEIRRKTCAWTKWKVATTKARLSSTPPKPSASKFFRPAGFIKIKMFKFHARDLKKWLADSW